MNTNNKSNIQTNLINTGRNLWGQRFYWFKALLDDIECNFNNLTFITQRILENIKDFTYEFQKYYDYDKTKIFEFYLNTHFYITLKILNDIKAGDVHSLDEDRIEWYKNADNISELLSSINPYWSKTEWQNLIYGHLYSIETEAINRRATHCQTEAINIEQFQNQIIKIADYMTSAIIQQKRI